MSWEREIRLAERALQISSAMIGESKYGVPSGRSRSRVRAPSSFRERKVRKVR